MAPKRKPERKTGIHILDDTPPSSNAEFQAQPSKAAPKTRLHTLANASRGRNNTGYSRSGRSVTADEDDSDYVEYGATLGSDNDGPAPELSNDAPGTIESPTMRVRSIRRA
ncbi:hypothetical protein MBLNU13_g03936t1 [Cladosporium sp. NU13]